MVTPAKVVNELKGKDPNEVMDIIKKHTLRFKKVGNVLKDA